MIGRPSVLDRRLLDAARTFAPVASIPVLVGPCGSGRTERLRRLHRELGPRTSQYIDIERIATTPERCFRAVVATSPFVAESAPPRASGTGGARAAFEALLLFLMNAKNGDGGPATFLLDEVLELRTFESFPGLRAAQAELARALANSPNRFILSTRFTARAGRWIEAAPERFELMSLAPLAPIDVRDALGGTSPAAPDAEADDLAQTVQLLCDGRPAYVRALLDTLTTLRRSGGGDPISALAAAIARGGEMDSRCRFSYELRLHRARGYGALKAILDVLSEEEPLTLTQIAQRLSRTPGSTKDYLSWLQDVDLLASHRKRYSFADPMLRLWVRVHGHAVPSDEDRVAREVQDYAMRRLQAGAAPAPVTSGDHQARGESASPAAAAAVAAAVAAAGRGGERERPAERPLARTAGAGQGPGAGAGSGSGSGSGIIEID
jgi:hypothetical protein